MRHLTNNDQAIRQSRGIPLWRFLPFLLTLLAILIMSSDDRLFLQCIGHAPNVTSASGAKYAMFARVLVAIPCSPYYLREFSRHWVVIAMFLAGIALAIPQAFWMHRHTVYWNAVRARERLKRAEKAEK